jgi:hypothetical protein
VLGLDAVGTLSRPGADIAIYGWTATRATSACTIRRSGRWRAAGMRILRWMFVGGKEVVRDGKVPGLDVIELGRQERGGGQGHPARALNLSCGVDPKPRERRAISAWLTGSSPRRHGLTQ